MLLQFPSSKESSRVSRRKSKSLCRHLSSFCQLHFLNFMIFQNVSRDFHRGFRAFHEISSDFRKFRKFRSSFYCKTIGKRSRRLDTGVCLVFPLWSIRRISFRSVKPFQWKVFGDYWQVTVHIVHKLPQFAKFAMQTKEHTKHKKPFESPKKRSTRKREMPKKSKRFG